MRGGVYYVDVVERHHKSVRLDASLIVNGFIDTHSQVFVAGELKVNREIMPYSHVTSHGPVVVTGEVYGCCLVGCEKMELSKVGSPDGMRTMLSLQDYSLKKLQMLKELNEMKAAKIQPLMAKLVAPVTKVAKLGKKVNMLPEPTKVKLLGAYKRYVELNEEKKKITTQLQILDEKINEVSARPRILVRGPVHSGVSVRIGDAMLFVKEPLHNVEFNLEGDEVVYKKIRE
nr:FapA family protein [Desulfurispira natronophila]